MSNVQHLNPREIPPGDGRNPITAFDADIIESVRVNRSAAERRVATLPGRRTVKKQWQAAWLVRDERPWAEGARPQLIVPDLRALCVALGASADLR